PSRGAFYTLLKRDDRLEVRKLIAMIRRPRPDRFRVLEAELESVGEAESQTGSGRSDVAVFLLSLKKGPECPNLAVVQEREHLQEVAPRLAAEPRNRGTPRCRERPAEVSPRNPSTTSMLPPTLKTLRVSSKTCVFRNCCLKFL